ncbi:allergen [Talaromyces pinophilus]|uniref:Allergen n=1 Tax=Talaromyces pinophilus TaxID=128442 RepID=A0A6V8HD93_TALPI|nr:allergen [Talaromyces pinophilus]
MTTLKPGDSFPSDVVFSYIPYSPESSDITACGIPISYNASKEWADKKVVLFSVPGYIQNLPQLKAKGVDIVAVLAFNDPFVMSAWGKANKITDENFLFLSDPDAKFSKSIGWADAASGRTGRYAVVIDHGKVTYADIETERGSLKKSGADTVLASL